MASPGVGSPDDLTSAAIVALPSSLSATTGFDGLSSGPRSSGAVDNTGDGINQIQDEEPMFMVEKVQLQFPLAAEFVAAAVANNVLILALQTGRIMRIDLDAPDEIDDIDLPRKPNEIGIIRRLFLDPTASHLIITTTGTETFYLHTQSKQPKVLSRLKGVTLESIAWNPSQPTASTREILVGASDGTIYEMYIESATEFYRREEKYFKAVFKIQGNGPITGLWVDAVSGKQDLRRVLVTTPSKAFHFFGKLGRHGNEGSGSVFFKIFDPSVPPVVQEAPSASADVGNTGSGISMLAVTPEPPEMHNSDSARPERIFAWSSHGGTVSHGRLLVSPESPDLGRKVFKEMQTLSASSVRDKFAPGEKRSMQSSTGFIALTQWHILQLVDDRILAFNRLDNSLVLDEPLPEKGHRPIALLADLKQNTFWLFTRQAIFEIEVRDEGRNIWSVLLKAGKYEDALQHANNVFQKDTIAKAYGDHLMHGSNYLEAANVYGRSSKPFEQVALRLIDQGQRDALRQYLLTKLSLLPKTSIMQRIMTGAWLTEIFMAKLNSLEDMVTTGAELTVEDKTAAEVKQQLNTVRREFQEFVRKYKGDLDKKTSYEIMSSHGREDELLFFAATMDDHNYVLAYWVQRENWSEALKALNKQTDEDIIYKYSTVLMTHAPSQLVDILMRQPKLDARKIIPALLSYNQITDAPLSQNQAIRYLIFEINHRGSTDSAVHNTLLSLYASNPTKDESALLGYLESQSSPLIASSKIETLENLPYDADFALRLCIQHSRIRSCVHIFMAMGQYSSAVALALEHNQVDLAISVADRSEHDQATRKKLWLSVARAVIASPSTADASAALKSVSKTSNQPKGLAHKSSAQNGTPISLALSLIHRAQPPGTLRIEDLLPLLPSFLKIDTLKEEITSALASYTASIEGLRTEMDASAATSARIDTDIKKLKQRWVLVQPGESCAVCGQVLVDRRFWVWSCGHGAHGDCVRDILSRRGSKVTKRRVRELRTILEGALLNDTTGSSAATTGPSAAGSTGGRATAAAVASASAISSGVTGAAAAAANAARIGTRGGSGPTADTRIGTAANTGAAGDGGPSRTKKESARRELDEICGAECPLCGDLAIRSLDEPLINSDDNKAAWAL